MRQLTARAYAEHRARSASGRSRSVATRPDERARQHRLIKRVTHSWRIRKIDPALAIHRKRLSHHEIASLQAPIRWIKWVLEERRVRQSRRQLSVRRHTHAIRPGMRREHDVLFLRDMYDASQPGNAPD